MKTAGYECRRSPGRRGGPGSRNVFSDAIGACLSVNRLLVDARLQGDRDYKGDIANVHCIVVVMTTTTATPKLKEALSSKINDLACAVVNLAEVNSGSYNPDGVDECGERLAYRIEPLAPDKIETIAVAPSPTVDQEGRRVEHTVGKALRAVKRPDAPFKVCMFGHLDTVFEADHPFQTVKRDGSRLNGPGVADCKGGLILAVEVLRYLDQTDWGADVGWEFLVVPDEEVGSVGSKPLLAEAARRCDIGLGFEPALPSGGIAAARKGILNLYAAVRGSASHAGRARHEGCSAIRGLAALIDLLEMCNERPGVTVNCGWVKGGGALNIVPDFAIGGYDVRVSAAQDREWIHDKVAASADAVAAVHDLDVELIWPSERPPKIRTPALQQLIDDVCESAASIGEVVVAEDTGGACDGNDLAGYGLANVDSLGICGGEIHSDREFADVASIPVRAEITARVIKQARDRHLRDTAS